MKESPLDEIGRRCRKCGFLSILKCSIRELLELGNSHPLDGEQALKLNSHISEPAYAFKKLDQFRTLQNKVKELHKSCNNPISNPYLSNTSPTPQKIRKQRIKAISRKYKQPSNPVNKQNDDMDIDSEPKTTKSKEKPNQEPSKPKQLDKNSREKIMREMHETEERSWIVRQQIIAIHDRRVYDFKSLADASGTILDSDLQFNGWDFKILEFAFEFHPSERKDEILQFAQTIDTTLKPLLELKKQLVLSLSTFDRESTNLSRLKLVMYEKNARFYRMKMAIVLKNLELLNKEMNENLVVLVELKQQTNENGEYNRPMSQLDSMKGKIQKLRKLYKYIGLQLFIWQSSILV
ncbi:hypothetical protein HK098_001523 [Nowakowskiella sp. JEL0407]|nr:hypothetical protein HK098_001523 [Nowakowskiella sp. JEL0407]